jgi:spermidine synthase
MKDRLPEGCTLVEETESEFQRIQVVDLELQEGIFRALVFNGHVQRWQSGRWLGQYGKPPYIDNFLLAWLYRPEIRRIAVLGAGGGNVVRRILDWFPEATTPDLRIDAVELDRQVLEMARRHFDYPEDGARLKTHVGDGVAFLENCAEGSYDLVILDAFSAEGTVPDAFVTQEFLRTAHRKLAPGGVLALNFLGALQNLPSQPESRRVMPFVSTLKTARSVFGEEDVFLYAMGKRTPLWRQVQHEASNVNFFMVKARRQRPDQERFAKLASTYPHATLTLHHRLLWEPPRDPAFIKLTRQAPLITRSGKSLSALVEEALQEQLDRTAA